MQKNISISNFLQAPELSGRHFEYRYVTIIVRAIPLEIFYYRSDGSSSYLKADHFRTLLPADV